MRRYFIIFISFLFFLLRLPSLIEPYWYGDEGVYEIIGRALNNGRMLYSQAWDNKPPLLYLIYAIANGDQFTVRLLSLLCGLGSAILFYYLANKLFRSHKISSISTVFYTLLFATPILEGNIANAENFMLLPIIAAGLLVYRVSEIKKRELFIAGLLLGIAFLLKIVAVFDFAAFFIFLAFIFLPEKLFIKENKKLYKDLLKKLVVYTSGFLIPVVLTVLYFFIQGSLADFAQATFFSNIGYVGYKNNFIISQGFLVFKLLVLFAAVALVFWKRKFIPKSIIFILLWFFFSIFNAFFSGREWTHYLLVLLPSTALLVGLLFERKAKKLIFVALCLLLILMYYVNVFFKIGIGTIGKTLQYYQNFSLFITNNKSVREYQEYFDRRVPRDYEVARFIANNTKPNDIVFIWGNSPQIYVLSNTLPPGKYTVEYHISQSSKAIAATADDLKRTKPKYLILLPGTPPFPFSIGTYMYRFNLEGADIYERTI
jgi:4-amino-4-deoxy-L-arabinose transferase-like glycosyltransferase